MKLNINDRAALAIKNGSKKVEIRAKSKILIENNAKTAYN